MIILIIYDFLAFSHYLFLIWQLILSKFHDILKDQGESAHCTWEKHAVLLLVLHP